MNGILKRLENKGFIKRTISEIDARNKEIYLTEKSILLDKKMKSKICCIEQKLVSGIKMEELNIFNQVILKMFSNIGGDQDEKNI